MKLNFDFYICNSNEEEYINEVNEFYPDKISNIKNNILSWYKFKKDAEILEIGSDINTITSFLANNSKTLTTVCESKSKAEFLSGKYKEIQNLEMYVGELSKIKFDKRFDYVIFYNLNQVEVLKDLLKEKGIAIMLVDNKFSISHFAGAKPQIGEIFSTIMENGKNTFSMNTILSVLEKNDFKKYKFYYPFPNYRFPNVIFSDEYLPKYSSTKLLHNVYYNNGSLVVFDELKALKQITRDGQFKNFANSYLIEINNIQDEQPKFISFNNNRKVKYRLMTKIYNELVEKTACSTESEAHIKNIIKNSNHLRSLGFNVIDEKKENIVLSKFINFETFDNLLVRTILDGKIEETYKFIETWYKDLFDKLVSNSNVVINEDITIDNLEKYDELTIIEHGYIDIVFENTFFKNNDFILFDQEWYIERIPIEFILYRAISNLYIYNKEINKIVSKEEILNRFKLLKYESLFKFIEKYIQEEINDKDMSVFNEKSLNMLIDINSMSLLNARVEDYKENDMKQNEYIKFLEEDNRNKQEYINVLEKRCKRKFF